MTIRCLLLFTLIGSHLAAQSEMIDPAEKPQKDASTILLLDFEEADGGIATDQSEFLNHGTIQDAKPCEGRFGKALAFDGEDDFVDCKGEKSQPPSFDFNETTDFTVEFFLRADEGGEGGNLINKKLRTDEKEPGWMILTARNKRAIALLADGVHLIKVENPTVVIDGAWHHVALVVNRKDNQATLYVDGAPGDVASLSGLLDLTNPERALRIGDRAYDGDFKGEIDEVRISNVARTIKQ